MPYGHVVAHLFFSGPMHWGTCGNPYLAIDWATFESQEQIYCSDLAHGGMSNKGTFGALTGEHERADEFIRLIGQYHLYQSRRMRMLVATDPDDADDSVEKE